MSSNKICWDACVFTALLKGEQRPADEISGLREIVDLVDRKKVVLITSALIETEVIGELDDATLQERLEALFQRPNIVQVAASAEILRKAGLIRKAARESNRSLKTPDAVYVATAILHAANSLQTFDDKLLALSESPIVDGLQITKPRGMQTVLQL